MYLVIYLIQRNKKLLAIFIGFLHRFLELAAEITWIFVVFKWITRAFYIDYGVSYMIDTGKIVSLAGGKLIPYLLYGFGIALSPFQFMASKEPPMSPESVISEGLS